MTLETITETLAPCGLNCKKCFAHVDGDIRRYSQLLKERLGNFEPYAKRFETLLEQPVFKNYPAFVEMLDHFASKNCSGCRNQPCPLFKGCGVRVCDRQDRPDFCYECPDFPCDRTGFDEALYANWVRINRKILETGIQAFCEASQKRPRYL